MKLTATDSLHVSSVSPHSLVAGQTFEVNDHEGADLVKRGLAVAAKAGAPHDNKMATAPANKAVKPPLAAKRKSDL